MKKIFKNPIFMFVFGLVIASLISVYARNASEITYKETTVDAALDDLYDKAQPTSLELLWTNPNPTSAFAAQTINIDLSNYKYVVINATYGGNGIKNDYLPTHMSIIEVGTTSNFTGVHSNDQVSAGAYAATVRKVTVTTTGIQFGPGRFYKGSNLESNDYAVPLNIWGIK